MDIKETVYIEVETRQFTFDKTFELDYHLDFRDVRDLVIRACKEKAEERKLDGHNHAYRNDILRYTIMVENNSIQT